MEENDILPPRPKKGCRLRKQQPLPLLQMENGEIKIFQGFFDGFSVIIKDPEDMKNMVSMGYFGKGSLSRSYPSFDGTMEKPEIIRNRQFQSRKNLSKNLKLEDLKKVIVLPDSSEEDESEYFTNLQSLYEIDRTGNKESVNLMLEEAFFLQSALKCLEIFQNNSPLTSDESWTLFTESDTSFPLKYVAYYHFRSKNWVVRPGLKFGGDFLLYKDGPPFFHASYVVRIQIFENDICVNKINTTTLIGLQRLCESSAKELLLFQIYKPEGSIHFEKISSLSIKEVLMKRWIPSQEREEYT